MSINKDPELRKQLILKKYGSWDAYEKARLQTFRKNKLAKQKTEEDRSRLQREFEFEDFIKESYDATKIGEECVCISCSNSFIGNKSQQIYCRACYLKETKIRRFGSLEAYNEKSQAAVRKTKNSKYKDPNYNNREKFFATIEEKAGSVENYYHHIREKTKKTKLDRYGDENYNNIEQGIQTWEDHHGGIGFGAPEIEAVRRKNNMKKQGHPNWANWAQTRTTNFRRYGGPAPSCDSEVLQRIRETMITNSGSLEEHYSEVWNKAKATMVNRHGVDNYSKLESRREQQRILFLDPSFQTKLKNAALKKHGAFNRKNKLLYEGVVFDSSWELLYYLKHKEEKIERSNFRLPYYDPFLQKLRTYYPDFMHNGIYIEVKGGLSVRYLNGLPYITHKGGTIDYGKHFFLRELETAGKLLFIFKEEIETIKKELTVDMNISEIIKKAKLAYEASKH